MQSEEMQSEEMNTEPIQTTALTIYDPSINAEWFTEPEPAKGDLVNSVSFDAEELKVLFEQSTAFEEWDNIINLSQWALPLALTYAVVMLMNNQPELAGAGGLIMIISGAVVGEWAEGKRDSCRKNDVKVTGLLPSHESKPKSLPPPSLS